MVFTRSQKRSGEGDEANQVNEQFSNVSMVKRRKTDQGNNDGERDDSTEEEDEFITETDTEVTEFELPSEGENEEEEEENEANEGGQLQKVLNLKLNQKQVQQIIREAVKVLIKKYDGEGMEFLDDVGPVQGDDEYERFMEFVDAIYSGDFFQRVPVEDRKRRVQKQLSVQQMKELNEELAKLQVMYKENAPSIVDILTMKVDASVKQKLLEKVYQYTNSEVLTGEYNANLKYLMNHIKKDEDENIQELEKKIRSAVQSDKFCDDYRRKILKSNMSFENKVIAFKRLEIMETYEESDSSEYAKYKNWMDTLLSVPFGHYIQIPKDTDETMTLSRQYVKHVREVLDERLSFLEKPKDQIINIVTQMVRNPDLSINAIGLWGARGVGKTSIVKSISEALERPYRVVSLGGESDASMLTGHGFTYVGSNPGRLIEILRETKCMNPIVLIDELDKVSQTHHGKEIIGTLIHLTDSTTNAKYNYDRYFAGIDFDLSKVLFIFTYNDATKIDKILADRLFKINVQNYSLSEKMEITNKHLINNVIDQFKFPPGSVTFADEAVAYIVQSSKDDEGMRDIKRKFEIIVSRINTLLLTQESENIIRLKYKQLYQHYTALPVKVLKEHVDIFLSDSITSDLQDSNPPPGMYT